MTNNSQAATRAAEVAAMKVGGYVYNVPYQKSGIILEVVATRGCEDVPGAPERVFMVAWDDGTIHMAGDTFLQQWWPTDS